MSGRGKWQGVSTIVRFNWPFYLAALVVLIFAGIGGGISSSFTVSFLCAAAFLGAIWFLVGSLGSSYLIYDRSDLYRFQWLQRALDGRARKRIVFCHSGFDETSSALRAILPDTHWVILDHYNAATMVEPSIRRARRRFPPTAGTVAAPFDAWPVEPASTDVVLGLLAIHELRSEEERAKWFAEASCALAPGGCVILVEHLRDAANFAAFGPGFLHFHSRASWQRSWERAGLRLADEFCITPWLRVFVITVP